MPPQATDPRSVVVPSADGRTLLICHLWRPAAAGPVPAVVMLHGRTGAYSSTADGVYSARTLSRRHRTWGEFWASQGYVALHVDSFGARGHVGGFPQGSIDSRPPEVSEKEVRPLDAYGALEWLRGQPEVRADAIGLHGWSNGAMAALWAMSSEMPPRLRMPPGEAFRAALAFYPGCSRVLNEAPGYTPYAPVLMLLAGRDEEVSPERCRELAGRVGTSAGAGLLEQHTYPGAGHNFDDPGKTGARNTAARNDALQRAAQFFAAHLGGGA